MILAPHLLARRYRRIFVASLATLVTSALLLGLVGFLRWRGQQALQGDTRSAAEQAADQLLRGLQSRRGTLTFIRDVLNRRSDLTKAQLQAMGASAVEHTRHLLAAGLLDSDRNISWWYPARALNRTLDQQLTKGVRAHSQLRGFWRVPSTVLINDLQRPLLVMVEPLRAGNGAVIGVFDVKPLLEDFFATGLRQRYPAQVLDDHLVLYRSPDWEPVTETKKPIIVADHLRLDTVRWMVHLQPGSSGVVRTLSWFTLLLIALAAISALGITAIVWILAARAWILERAVARRTSALRRATQRLRQLATTDELTGLHNRRFFLNRWQWECDRAKRYQRPLACLMVDVNGFKLVNDRLGHAAGDVLLKSVAEELRTALRQSDILARFGGDEFIVALPETTPEQATAVAQKLRQIKVYAPVPGGQSVPPVSLSVGLSHIQEHDHNPQALLEAADQALYSDKRRSKLALPASR